MDGVYRVDIGLVDGVGRPVGVEGADAQFVLGRQIVDIDLFAGKRIGAAVDGSRFAFRIGCGQLGEGRNPRTEVCFAVGADEVDLQTIVHFAELHGGGRMEDDAVGGQCGANF